MFFIIFIYDWFFIDELFKRESRVRVDDEEFERRSRVDRRIYFECFRVEEEVMFCFFVFDDCFSSVFVWVLLNDVLCVGELCMKDIWFKMSLVIKYEYASASYCGCMMFFCFGFRKCYYLFSFGFVFVYVF